MTDTVMVYAVYWPERGVLKVGRTTSWKRTRSLMQTGGVLMLELTDRHPQDERAALTALRGAYRQAFRSEPESKIILPRGRGFTECFMVTADELAKAIETIFRGIARHGIEQTKDAPTGHLHGRAASSVASRSAVDRDRVEGQRGQLGTGISKPGTVEGNTMAAGGGGNSGRRVRPSRHVAGGRVPLAVRGGRRAVGVRPRGLAFGVAQDGRALPLPGPTFRRLSGNLPGRGERERGARGGARSWVHPRKLAAIKVLSRASCGDVQAVWSVWDCAGASPVVAGGGGGVREGGVVTRPQQIVPVGMSYERALEIAVESLGRTGESVRNVPSGHSSGFRLSGHQRERIVTLCLSTSLSLVEVALEMGVTDRTVSRVLADYRADVAWRAEQKRRRNLESFRHMTEVWFA